MECTSDWNENVCIHREYNIQCVLWDRGTGLCTCKRATGTHVSMKGERSMVKCMRYMNIMRGRERESKGKQVTKPINNLLWNKINELYTFQEK